MQRAMPLRYSEACAQKLVEQHKRMLSLDRRAEERCRAQGAWPLALLALRYLALLALRYLVLLALRYLVPGGARTPRQGL
jgi:hypothetical protein